MNDLVWLENTGVRQLLHLIVDRLDRANAKGQTVVRPLRLDEKSFPALYKAEYESDKEQLWAYVEQIASHGWLRIKLDTARAGKAHYERNPRIDVTDEQSIRIATGRMARRQSQSELWRKAVFEHLIASDNVREIVSRFLINVPGKNPEEIVRQMNGLKDWADEPLLLREVSARLFWGLSKILDGRHALVAAILEADDCPFPDMPVHLQAFLPPSGFGGVLFIENLATFEQATRDSTGKFAELALIFASGFKGSAKRLRSVGGSSVYFAAHGTLANEARSKFETWLYAGNEIPCWFWGDLDYSGMAIIQSLRATFDNLQAWERGYTPMLTALNAGQGHDPEEAGKSAQRPVAATGCQYTDMMLIPALQLTKRFVDQEMG